MPENTAAMADSLDPIFKNVYYQKDKPYPSFMNTLFTVENTNLLTLKESKLTGVGLIPRKTQGAAASSDQRYQGYDQSYTQLFYSLEVEATREMLDFDLHGNIANLPKAMRRSTDATIETIGANHFNRHINGSYLGPDGVVLCSNSHPNNHTSAVHDNLGTAGSMTHTTIADLRLLQKKMKNEAQIPEMLGLDYLLVPLDLEEKARIITGDHYKSGSSNYDVNILNGAGLKILANPYITVTTAYWIVAKDNFLKWFWSAAPEFNRDKGVSEQVAKWYVYFRCVSGWTDFRGVVGNNGA
jgi:hypothetical protein